MPKPGRIMMYTSGWPKNQNRCWNMIGSPPPAGIEELGAEVAVGQQHGDRAGENRQRQHQQERRHEHRPGEQRHLVQRHARRAHVEDGDDEVDGAEDRRDARDVQRQDHEVHRQARVAGGRERRIEHPAAADAVGARLALARTSR